ncbi:sulfopyruvate decarboxylase subunit alpha /sulfopyruvate decarboxylase subunit beta [Methanosarcina thermophila]|jgi:sulfopyruvate decarboxylase beta subunit|uniref:sulfopyruvate decarboxylase n=3 Tax=Methanosarcina thermophila TaxID=2210 RepID=A0A1I6Z9X8_METTE|nr:sulfopyruvate decarboxylase subunit beta [Methanosarcina thermophila]AKB11871.1 Sulfopyruvate decarboxylase - alpha subunit [Methanosarcina thermophila TM-1]AKB14933.1 Sulfopyruvate decarboxylase - alpha subunit [Methanosarcina thermophila CHTI-55]NLU55874.1 sulfopyruvate decarboxylase subunit beta [Methanosarcina thermophila]SFT59499.1 sulfopyruvate decarboxylase subunit alpha /sulfopyruvate decarboxylase subunit beta [Methanosarcina thermophila]BAW29511.1 sulfopyruvate decarboxylase subun
MANPEEEVIAIMKKTGIDLAATLPCDRIKNLLPLVSENFPEIRLTREENGVGICAGAYLAGGKPMMLIQSTGLGNMINALESLNVICKIPLPVLASWRGVYREGIEAQVPLGVHLSAILEGAGLEFTVIHEAEKLPLLENVIRDAFENLRPHIALISPKVWEGSECCAWEIAGMPEKPEVMERTCRFNFTRETLRPLMLRNDAICAIASELDDEITVINLGVPCKELYACRDRDLNFYMFGSMGLVSSIGLGIALRTKKTVVTFDGDGSLLMNPNALLEIAREAPKNLIIICLDNGAYGSTGSQETCALRYIDLEILANACGIQNTAKVNSREGLIEAFRKFRSMQELSFIHVILKPGNTGAPNIPLSPEEVTKRFKEALKAEN